MIADMVRLVLPADFLINPPTVTLILPPGCISGSAEPVWPRVIWYVFASTYAAVPDPAHVVGYAIISPRGVPTFVTSHFHTTPVTLDGTVTNRLNDHAACEALVGFEMVTVHCTGWPATTVLGVVCESARVNGVVGVGIVVGAEVGAVPEQEVLAREVTSVLVRDCP